MQVIEVQHKHNVQNTQTSHFFFPSPISNKKTNADVYFFLPLKRMQMKNKEKNDWKREFIKGGDGRGNKQQIKLSAVSIKNL